MRIELSVIEKIEQYLMGTLSAKDQSDFERQVQQSSELKSQVDFQDQLVRGIQNLALKRSAVQAYETYKLKKLLILAGIILVVVSAVLTSILFWPESKTDVIQNQSTNLESGTENAESENEIPIEAEQANISLDSTMISEPVHENKRPVFSSVFKAETSGMSVNSNASNVANVVTTNDEILISQPAETKDESLDKESLTGFSNERIWVITKTTSTSDLKRIEEEIKATGGSMVIDKMRRRGESLLRIAFVVSSKNGEVSYDSGDALYGEGAKICIRMGEKTISAGFCGNDEDLNERVLDNSIGDTEYAWQSETSTDFAVSNSIKTDRSGIAQFQGRSVALLNGTEKRNGVIWDHYFKVFRPSVEKRFKKEWKEMDTLMKKFEAE